MIAFEPSPSIHDVLSRNVAMWRGRGELAAVEVKQLPLSDRAGTTEFVTAPKTNMGLGRISSKVAGEAKNQAISVQTERLDQLVDHGEIGVLKIDVEGHEAGVL